MNDTPESDAQGALRWLLLIHQLPPEPAYLRVKIRRRLQKLGAVALKNTVYVLPETDEHLEDFQWLAGEIEEEGGDATICSATMISGASDAELLGQFGEAEARPQTKRAEEKPRGATWVTRKGVFVDRIASAWLIRHYIDPAARFKFVPAQGYRPKPGELRFDMYKGEYGHEGDRCTFETLIERFGLRDAKLKDLAEIVHDIDCKDDKFGRAEAEGIAAVFRGIRAATDDDEERIERGSQLLDGLLRQR